jgi:imidazolonepropionase-like amidohydrolase
VTLCQIAHPVNPGAQPLGCSFSNARRFCSLKAALRAPTLAFIVILLLPSTRIHAAALLLTGATVHTITGETLSPGDVLLREGKIAEVAKTISAEGATRVDLSGQHLYPGMISLDTVLGLTEIEAVRATADEKEVGDFTPDVESWISVNPDSELIPVARANGIAYFEPVPLGAIIAGQSGLMAVDGWTTEQLAVKTPVALHLFWPTMELDTTPKDRARGKTKPKSLDEQAKERRVKVQSLVEFFEEAKAYAKAKDAAAKGLASAPELVPAWDAMLPYVRGERPVTIHADEVRQIRSAITWATTNELKIILAGGRDAYMLASLLAAKQIPVIYEHTYTQPSRDTESYDVHFKAPSVLQQAGVKMVFSIGPRAFDAPQVRNLPYSAAQAVAFGLPESEALKGLTLYPAQLAGVADRLGSIEVGKDATLFAVAGDILDTRAQIKHLWLAGKEVSLETRQTRLYEKYKARPK